ncbi:MAG: AAA family ATPase [Candidatus Hydrothermales bacterium]
MELYEFFGFKKDPFAMVPDPELFYPSKIHREALEKIKFCITKNRGGCVLTGEVGTGKSMILRKLLLDFYQHENYIPLFVLFAHQEVNVKWFLKKIARFFGLNESEDIKILREDFISKILESFEMGKKFILLLDEAHKIKSAELLSFFRDILSIETMDEKPVSFVFVGLSEIIKNFREDPNFSQRIPIWVSLEKLDESEIVDYINFRLKKAGGSEDIFTLDAKDKVKGVSNGIPRLINAICDASLLESYVKGKKKVELNEVEKVITTMGL